MCTMDFCFLNLLLVLYDATYSSTCGGLARKLYAFPKSFANGYDILKKRVCCIFGLSFGSNADVVNHELVLQDLACSNIHVVA